MYIANTTIAEDEGLLTIKQVAAMAEVTPQVLHYARRKGWVPQPTETAGDGLKRYYSPTAAAECVEYFRQQQPKLINN